MRKLIAVLSSLVLAAATATVFAVQARNHAIGLATAELSSRVSGTAVQLRTSDRVLAAQLAVAAWHLSHTPEARGAVLSALVNLDPPRRSNADTDNPADAVAFSSDGLLLVARGLEASIWKLGNEPRFTDSPIALLQSGQLRSAVFSHNGRWLATSSVDNVVRLWAVDDALRGKVQLTPISPIPATAGSVVFSQDDKLLVTGGRTPETIQLWDMTTGKPQPAGMIHAHDREVSAVAISPDGHYLASASANGTAKLWDIAEPHSPKPLSPVGQDMDGVYSVAFSPNGKTLATANSDTTARLFDVNKPTAPRQLWTLDGHLRPVSGVAFSADRHTLVTTSQDSTARLWNVSDPGHPILLATPLAGKNDTIRSVAFSPDRHTLVTVQGNNVILWETDVDLAITEICETVPSSIKPDQWDRYFPEQNYQPTCPAHADSPFRNPTMTAPASSTPLIALNSKKCIVIKDDGAPIGAPAHQVNCANAPGEKWALLPADPAVAAGNAGDRVFYIRNAVSNMCLESSDAERRFGDATQVVQRRCGNNDVQRWILRVLSRGADSLDVVFMGLRHKDCLNINGESIDNGTYVIRYPCHEPNHTNEIFQINADAYPH